MSATPDIQTVPSLFEAQARRTPEASAVQFGSRVSSYAELNAEANRLARRLRSRGVRLDVPVGVCIERSPEMIVAQLAVMKAGGAYVSIESTNPAPRIAQMLRQSSTCLVLTSETIDSSLAAAPCARVVVQKGAFNCE